MSRIGKKPIPIPQGLKIELKEEQIKVNGPKGELVLNLNPEIKVEIKDNQIIVVSKNKSKLGRSLHGLTRTLIVNMIKGVTEGFVKTLKVVGTGYRVKLENENLILTLGFSHPVVFKPPEGIKFTVEGNDTFRVIGIDKVKVGDTAAKIRAICPPEPYKGKGIRYIDEEIKLKPGKAGKTGAVAGGGGK